MKRVRWFVREWMIGYHQGCKERHERVATRHREAEARWRCRAHPSEPIAVCGCVMCEARRR